MRAIQPGKADQPVTSHRRESALLQRSHVDDEPVFHVTGEHALAGGIDVTLRIVGSPGYFERRPVPQSAKAMLKHNGITLRLSGSGGIYA